MIKITTIPKELDKKSLLEDLLLQCTDTQQTFFDRVFPKGITEDNINTAISLCERTVASNNLKGGD